MQICSYRSFTTLYLFMGKSWVTLLSWPHRWPVWFSWGECSSSLIVWGPFPSAALPCLYLIRPLSAWWCIWGTILLSQPLWLSRIHSHELAISLQGSSLFFFVGSFFVDLFFAAALGTSLEKSSDADMPSVTTSWRNLLNFLMLYVTNQCTCMLHLLRYKPISFS